MSILEFLLCIGALFCIGVVGGFAKGAFPDAAVSISGMQVALGVLSGTWIARKVDSL